MNRRINQKLYFQSLSFSLGCFSCIQDAPGWDGGRTNGFVNGYHDNRANGGFGGRGSSRNDRGGRCVHRGKRGGGSFNQPLQNAAGKIPLPSASDVKLQT